jgi:hypothetical protein
VSDRHGRFFAARHIKQLVVPRFLRNALKTPGNIEDSFSRVLVSGSQEDLVATRARHVTSIFAISIYEQRPWRSSGQKVGQYGCVAALHFVLSADFQSVIAKPPRVFEKFDPPWQTEEWCHAELVANASA